MAIGDLPAAVRSEIEELRRSFDLRCEVVGEEAILTTWVRKVPVVVYLDLSTYPSRPPRLDLLPGWSWLHPEMELGAGRQIEGLLSQRRWNRTLGLGAQLRELEGLFRQVRPRKEKLGFWRRLRRWLTRGRF